MIRNYLKTAWRTLLRHRGYALINIFSLAIGLAAFILIAAFVRKEWNYDRFHQNAENMYRIVRLSPEESGEGGAQVGGPWAPALAEGFSEVAGYSRLIRFGRTLVRYEDQMHYEDEGILADSSFFNFFSFPLVRGNPATVLDEPFTVVIDEAFAKRYFGTADPVGKTLLMDGSQPYRVTGVMKTMEENSHLDFNFVASFDSHDAWFKRDWEVNNYWAYLKLSPGADPGSLEAKLPEWLNRHFDPTTDRRFEAALQPLADIHLKSHYQGEFRENGSMQTVLILAGIGLLILLIACVNFTNLATARAGLRTREIGIRKVVGARRRQLITQYLSESILLSGLSFLVALVLVEFFLPYFNAFYGGELDIAYFSDLPFSVFLLSAVCLTGVLAGVYPALYLSGFQPVRALKGERLKVKKPENLFRQGLVVGQFAASIVLLVATGIILQQLNFLMTKDLGFDRESLLVLRMPDSSAVQRLEARTEQLTGHPGIEAIAAASGSLGGGDWGMPLRYEGSPGEPFSTRVMAVDEAYLPTHHMELLRGRNFSRNMPTDETAFLLNETAAKKLGWEDPLGKWLERPVGRNEDGEWEFVRGPVIGVVKDYHFRSLHQAIDPLVLFWEPDYLNYYFVRLTKDRQEEAMGYLETAWEEIAPAYPFDYFFLDQRYDQMYRSEDRLSKLFRSFAALAVLIACLGLFGLAAYQVERRTREIGIRKVLGASTGQLLLRFSRQFVRLVVVAFFIAAPIGWWLMQQWLRHFAYQTSVSWWVFLLSGLLALSVAWLAVSYHAFRAARANPVRALRTE